MSEKLHFYKAWLAMTKGDIMSTSRLQRHFKSHSSIQSSIQSFSLLNLQLQIVTKDNIKIRLILIIFLFIQELWFFITSTWFPPLISIKHICYLQLICTKYDFFLLLLYLYYTCEQFTSGCQETSKVYKYLQWTIYWINKYWYSCSKNTIP